MAVEICHTCGKQRIVKFASFSMVRRAAFGIDLCVCDANPLSEQAKEIIRMIREAKNKKEG